MPLFLPLPARGSFTALGWKLLLGWRLWGQVLPLGEPTLPQDEDGAP